MDKLESIVKKRYLVLISTTVLAVIIVLVLVQHSIALQASSTHLINFAGKQRMLCQRTINLVTSIGYNEQNKVSNASALNSLKIIINELENGHNYLYSANSEIENSRTIDSLFNINEAYLNNILLVSRELLRNPSSEIIKSSIASISKEELPFLITMDNIVDGYQRNAENHLQNLKHQIYFIAFIVCLILLVQFHFVLRPVFKLLLERNKTLRSANNKLKTSKKEVVKKVEELGELKKVLEIQEKHNKVFIEQAPTAIAMVDNNMCYIAVSQRWITDYKMEGKEFIGRSHYDLFPEIGDDWKQMHQRCLNGATDINDEVPFVRIDGSLQWIFWHVRPWYNSDDSIGGIIMQTGDITHIKEKEVERIRIEKILDKTNEVARIGTWDIDLIKNKIFWSRMVREIHEVSENYEPDLETAINFYKKGKSLDTIEKAVKEAIEYGTSYDIEVELVTANNNIVWTRAMGQAEIVDGKCVRIYGVFQDIDKIKKSEIALNKANTELKAIFNSGAVAIVATEVDGVISHFNHGAEVLTGYSASEMIGLQRPTFFHLQEELDTFRIDIAKLYGKNPIGFSAQLEMSKHNAHDTREWHYRRKDGSIIPVQLTLTSIKDEQDKLIGFLGISTDVSEKRIAQDELLRKNKLLNFAEEITLMGHWQWDTVTNKVEWSNNLYNIFNLDKEIEHLDFETYFNFVHHDDKETVTNYFDKIKIEKKLINLVHRIIAGDGTLKIIQLLGEVITDNLGNVVEMIGTCQDVTEQKMAENKFRGLLESAPDAMVIVNEKGKIQLINKQAEKLFGYSIDELLNKSVEMLIPKRFTGAHTTHRDGFFSSPKTRRMGDEKELYGINKKGNEIPIHISLSPLKTEEGLLVSAAIRDITEQKLAQNKIIKAKDDLEIYAKQLSNQNTQLADFAQITSHNLRAPVSNLNSLLGFYKIEESEEEKEILFEKFESVINTLTLTLNTLVDAVKIKNIDSIEVENILFDDILNNTKKVLSGSILKTNTIIKSDFTKVPKIKYNQTYLESIFLNLVSNAIKYKSEDRNPEIIIKSETINGRINLIISDNGLGINLDRHGKKIFGLNKTFHRHPDAKGVGLYMTKTQVQAMGGTIKASSKVDEGAMFTIIF